MPVTNAAKSYLKKSFPGLLSWQATRRSLWKAYWLDGEWELRELHKYTSKDAVAIDIGGNIGEYSYHLGRLSHRVITFEPNPDYVKRIRDLRIKNIEIHTVALSSGEGEATLRIPAVGEGREDAGMASLEAAAVSDDQISRTLTVPLKTLDSFGFDNIGFIKIDVEGHEEGVLAGAHDTIRRNKPAILIEVEERHNKGGVDRVVQTLASLGYDAYFFDNGVRHSYDTFQPEVHQKIDNLGDHVRGANRRAMKYINNFLFVPRKAA